MKWKRKIAQISRRWVCLPGGYSHAWALAGTWGCHAACSGRARGCRSLATSSAFCTPISLPFPHLCPPLLLLFTCNFMAGMLKKDLPGKDWLVHTLPGLYPAARASLPDKKLTAASYNRLKCFLCTGHHGVEQQRGEQPAWFWHTESPSHA